MAGFTVGGLATGLDTNSMIAQLMAVERKPRVRTELRQAAIQARQDALRDISTKLKALKTAAADLRSPTLWADTQSVASADSSKLAARLTGTAAAGTYDVAVTQLASSTQRTFTYAASNQARTLTFGSVSVNLATGASLDTAVSAINTANGNVTAANVGGKLVVTSKDLGNTGRFAWTDTGAGRPALTLDSEMLGKQATFTVNGGPAQTRDTNVVTDAIAGVELTLKVLTTGTQVTVGTPGLDKAAATTKIKAFVEAYNAAADAVRTRVEEKRVPNAATPLDAKKGSLFSDGAMTTVLSRLRIAISEPVAGNPLASDALADLGITTGAATATVNKDSVAGRLVLDEKTLTTALETGPDAVRRLLGGLNGVDGFAQRMEALIDPWTQAGGMLDSRITSADGDMSRLKASLERFDQRLTAKEERLRKQFTALETSISKLQSRQVDLYSALGMNRDS